MVKIAVDELISKARTLISQLRYVRSGDYVLSEDHNKLVDALKALNDLAEALKDYAEGVKVEAEKARYECRPRLETYPTNVKKPGITVSITVSTSQTVSTTTTSSIEVSVT